MKCLENQYLPGIYSLVNSPQWTWKNVIDYYKKPETIIEYKSKITQQNEIESSDKNTNGLFWNLLKSNKKYIKPFLYYASTKFEPQIKKKFAEKKMLNAISSIKNSLKSQVNTNEKLKSLQTQRYENAKAYLDELINNNESYTIPEGLTKLKTTTNFNIEEFSFNSIPGPFLDGLNNTRKLLDNYSENISFNQS